MMGHGPATEECEMAEIVLGLWTTHGPTLNTTPDQWVLRLPADLSRKHWFKGGLYAFDELVEMRKDEGLAEKTSDPERQRRYDACQAAIGAMADTWAEVAPDACVILGNDQHEVFLEDVQPAFTVYHGETFFHQPLNDEQKERLPPGIAESEWATRPDEYTEYPGLPDLADIVFELGMAEGFDLAASKRWPQHLDHHHVGMPHAFGYIFRRVMRDRAVPTLPIIANTFFPPNQPTARRCFDLGKLIRKAIDRWKPNARVAVVGSGGMSHFAIDEDLDRVVLDALQSRDERTLTSIEQNLLKSGSSEIRNWIAAAGVLFDSDLSGDVIDYVPCYRSKAGTGTANGFICWT